MLPRGTCFCCLDFKLQDNLLVNKNRPTTCSGHLAIWPIQSIGSIEGALFGVFVFAEAEPPSSCCPPPPMRRLDAIEAWGPQIPPPKKERREATLSFCGNSCGKKSQREALKWSSHILSSWTVVTFREVAFWEVTLWEVTFWEVTFWEDHCSQ